MGDETAAERQAETALRPSLRSQNVETPCAPLTARCGFWTQKRAPFGALFFFRIREALKLRRKRLLLRPGRLLHRRGGSLFPSPLCLPLSQNRSCDCTAVPSST